jgi:hypothetical protein
MARTIGTASYGLRAPIIQEGDDLVEIVTDIVLNSGIEIKNKDVIGITESLVARSAGCYVTLDEVVEDIKRLSNNADNILVFQPIYSRNRFAMILKAIARAAGKKVYIHMPLYDEVGNVVRNHPFTGLNYDEYYTSIVEKEGKECVIVGEAQTSQVDYDLRDIFREAFVIDSRTHCSHSYKDRDDIITLADICSNKCDYGLYGSNKSTEEMLKLFPSHKLSMELVNGIQSNILRATGKTVEVMVYGDGCFKDPVGGIWEFADPVVSPGYTAGLEGTPNELKLKASADAFIVTADHKPTKDELDYFIKEDMKASKSNNMVGDMAAQGTTPRRYVDLLGSLMDLTSGSGDKGTPIVYVQGYFDNYLDE